MARAVCAGVLSCWKMYRLSNSRLQIGKEMASIVSSKSRLVLTFLVLPFWYLLTRVDLDIFQTSSKMVVCVCVLTRIVPDKFQKSSKAILCFSLLIDPPSYLNFFPKIIILLVTPEVWSVEFLNSKSGFYVTLM